MNQPKRHHYLPKTYLSQFGRDAGVWVYDRNHRKVRWQQIEDTTVKRYFYAFEHPDGTRNLELETILSKIEAPLSDICGQLREYKQIGSEEHASLCLFAGFMMTRTPDFRSGVERIESQMIKKFSRMMFRTVDDAARSIEEWKKSDPNASDIDPQVLFDFYRKGEYEINIHKNRSLELMFRLAPSFADTLSRLNLGILHASRKAAFITCDRPFVIAPPKNDLRLPRWGGIGLLTPGAIKYLPLASDLMIVFGDPGDNFQQMTLSQRQVMAVNAVVGRMTDRFLVGRDESLVSCWSERLKLGDFPPVETLRVG